MSITLDGTSGITSPGLTNTGNETVSGTLTASGFNAASTFGFKNRIINGAMVIDQRNAGAAGSAATNTAPYGVDRWQVYGVVNSKFTYQQNAGSVTPPAGFTNYFGITSSSAYTPGSTERFLVDQYIEGFNSYDLDFGKSTAKTVTLSFWVYSSLTGSFGGSIQNYAGTRSYPFSYTISSANTWTYITITIPGDTSGTWVGASNAGSIAIYFSLGCGSTYQGTANSWASANYLQPAGTVNVVGTNGATWYITGVQLEKGSTATSFDYRPYGTELALCQRYLPVIDGSLVSSYASYFGAAVNTTGAYISIPFMTQARVAPTGITVSASSDFSLYNIANNTSGALTSLTFSTAGTATAIITSGTTAGTPTIAAGNPVILRTANTNAKVLFTGCEL